MILASADSFCQKILRIIQQNMIVFHCGRFHFFCSKTFHSPIESREGCELLQASKERHLFCPDK